MEKKYYLWLVPFITFFLGYQSIKFFLRESNIETPSIIGLSLGPAIEVLSSVKLNPKILAYKEDNSLPTGTIVSQSPLPGQKVKPNQSIFLVATKQTTILVSPDFIGADINYIKEKSSDLGINNKIFNLEGNKPENTCIAQNAEDLIIYNSSGETPIRIMPNLIKQNLQEVIDFLKEYGITPQIQYLDYFNNLENIDTSNYIVYKQKPEPFEFVNLKKTIVVKLIAKLET